MNTPWDDGIITEDEFAMMLGVTELKQMFMELLMLVLFQVILKHLNQ